MPNHNWAGRPLLIGKLKELSRKVAYSFAIKMLEAHTPKAIQN